jgi:hypothetical protein
MWLEFEWYHLTSTGCESVQRPEHNNTSEVLDKQHAEYEDGGGQETRDKHIVDTQSISQE